MQKDVKEELSELGARVIDQEFLTNMYDAEKNIPWLEQFDAFGNRIDKIHTSSGWKFMKD